MESEVEDVVTMLNRRISVVYNATTKNRPNFTSLEKVQISTAFFNKKLPTLYVPGKLPFDHSSSIIWKIQLKKPLSTESFKVVWGWRVCDYYHFDIRPKQGDKDRVIKTPYRYVKAANKVVLFFWEFDNNPTDYVAN